MATSKDFIVKHGLQVVGNVLFNSTANLNNHLIMNSAGSETRIKFTTTGGTDTGFFGRNTDGAVGMYDWGNNHGVFTYTPSTNVFEFHTGQVKGNFTGTSTNVTGTVAIANGGTGATTAAAALTNFGFTPGLTGQTYFVTSDSTNSVAPSFTMVHGKIVENASELTEAQNGTVDQSEVFSTWYRFSHNTTNTYPADAAETNTWTYNNTLSRIENTSNSVTTIGVVSPDSYDNYYFKARIASTNNDDDFIGIVLAFVIQNGREYTLTAFRSNNAASKWLIRYNHGQSDAYTVFNGDSTVTASYVNGGTAPNLGWVSAGVGCVIEAQRTGNTITAVTSEMSSTTLVEATRATISLTSDARLQKFVTPSRIGYMSQSQANSSWNDVVFTSTADAIYDIINGKKYTYNAQTQVWDSSNAAVQSDIGVGKFVFSTNNKRLYYVKNSAVVSNIINLSTATVSSANKLTTARTINGVIFDGTANITIATGEPVIAAGTTNQYYRGDKTWQDLASTVRGIQVSGLSLANSSAVAATDTILGSVGKLQAQINNCASVSYVDSKVAGLINSAPATLDTLDELAQALGDDPNFATTTANALGNRLRVDTNAQGLTAQQKTNAKTNIDLQNVENKSSATIRGELTSANVSTALGYTPLNASALMVQSLRDFANGTLIRTSIDYSVSGGAAWLLEITGNAYANMVPFDVMVQGYIYNDTIINHGGIANGTEIPGIIAQNIGGKLCFWFPRIAYWHGFNVFVADVTGTGSKTNTVTSIENSARPTGTKEVAFTLAKGWNSYNLTNLNQLTNGPGFMQSSGATMTGRLVLPAGSSGGLAFPDNAYGGSGDTASITLQNPNGSESTEMTFTMTNDAPDIFHFKAQSIDGMKMNGNTVLNAGNMAAQTQYRNFGLVQYGGADSTTATFLAWLNAQGFFNQAHSVAKCTWSYAGNTDITDTGVGNIELAGSLIETFKEPSGGGGVYGNIIVRITCPTTGASGGREFIYNDQGSGYSPGWRSNWNSSSLTNLNQLANGPGYATSNSPTFTGNVRVSTATGISAAGTTQGTATAIAADVNVVSTVAANSGVIMPAAVAGIKIMIINTSATDLRVYPASGSVIDSLGTNVAYVLGAGARLEFVAVSGTQWYAMTAVFA